MKRSFDITKFAKESFEIKMRNPLRNLVTSDSEFIASIDHMVTWIENIVKDHF